MKVAVDRTLCDNHGQCAITAPDVFTMNDEGLLEYTEEFNPDILDEVEVAMDACPVQAISIDEDS